ncbi:aldo/keto reductase [Pseudomonas chlororaphis]|uniref:Aldo/keto reductase n=2 Tax=Pseudomonas chlororaphis TaxID=587753 RepID=A0AAP9VZQ4_9PSED|nr:MULTISPECIES: aldo/keto reductase [Pseudomonas]AIC20087.1 alcohol dehydrogenase [Pseudomonas chlororaphis]AIS13013.1 alcohol dehydrogenase [Pseudomonas chlororaphis subsp. aurantiaca]AUG41121.1 aldo/keto reductase [Pseudomonas chlororaphis]AZE11379.1 L-fuco-beta-pyranose dehydrogenase [Pseudomonas chlororaphis subsp. aureofaciens]AZE17382.1 L-fuco-beta-pyranose dehydrogenase [Pseudomonas chlororaphis subsp. aureofaciens]
MDYRRLGRSGLKVSAIALGTAQCDWWVDEATSRRLFDTYVESGGNLIDTADVYPVFADGVGGKASEEFVGRWLQTTTKRHEVLLSTKVSGRMGPGPNDQGLSWRHIVKAVEGSLSRLQVDCIDLYQAHDDYDDVPVEETLRAFDHLVQRGLVRYVGCSNFKAWRLMKSLAISERSALAGYVSVQERYNLLERDRIESELQPLCVEEGVGLLPYNPLAKGFLCGRYQQQAALPGSPRAAGVQRDYFNARNWQALEVLRRIAQERDSSCTQVALAWLLSRPAVVAPVVGASSVEQLREIMAAPQLQLSQADLYQLNQVSAAPVV